MPNKTKEPKSGNLKESLDQIVLYLEKNHRKPENFLKKAATSSEIADAQSRFGYKLPNALQELFSWRNGTIHRRSNLGELYFFPWMYFLSVSEGVKTAETMRAASKQTELDWEDGWFPFMATGGGDYYVIVCEKRKKKDGAVIMYYRDMVEIPAVYSGIESMFLTVLACYSEGAYVIDKKKTFVVNTDLEKKISQNLNPKVSWWRQK
ncbi:MAG: SMI1/KNR4 family protein [Methylococcaceae bacterium]